MFQISERAVGVWERPVALWNNLREGFTEEATFFLSPQE